MNINSPTSSSPSTPTSNTHIVLTPSRKVQALLAQFSDSNSDSDSESQHIEQLKNAQNLSTKLPRYQNTNQDPKSGSEDSDDEEELQPRSRLAARLLGEGGLSQETISHIITNSVQSKARLSPSVQPVPNAGARSNDMESSDDEITAALPIRRRMLAKTKLDDENMSAPSRTTRSESPLFFPSPSATRQNRSPSNTPRQHATPSPPARTGEKGRSKFLVLVEKHRKERIAREAAEIAKRAAGTNNVESNRAQKVRGSSPADDSNEESASADEDAVKRIQQQARPTRKASRKALEEMNRETQRMNRNMQLAHQAKTKTKITKESLLARFSFATNDNDAGPQSPPSRSAHISGSVTTSDIESQSGGQTTPPTSPMRDIQDSIRKPDGSGVVPKSRQTFDGQTCNKGMQNLLDCHNNDINVKSPSSSLTLPVHNATTAGMNNIPSIGIRSAKFNLAHTLFTRGGDSSSEDEIEIVKDRGLKRKYAAFETLPKRKAKEMPSHLALRSLAYLVGNDDKKRSMNTAELEAALRRKARMQAIDERQHRIEELKSKGIVIQSAEEREQDQQEVENLVERARQEAVEIQKREKELAKKDGTYVKDNLDDDDDDESDDADFEDEELEASQDSASEEEEGAGDDNAETKLNLLDDEVEEANSEEEAEEDSAEENMDSEAQSNDAVASHARPRRNIRILSDDEDEEQVTGKSDRSPLLPPLAKTPLSVPRSVRKMIPGLQMSDDLPMGLSQAFAATMADSQTQNIDESQDQDSLNLTTGLPSPRLAPMPLLQRFESVELISDSQPSASQTQPLNIDLLSQSQTVPESPRGLGIDRTRHTPSRRQTPFELTQDNGYVLSPFLGNRFAETPNLNAPHSTVETVIMPHGIEDSPIFQKRGRLQRGRGETERLMEDDSAQPATAFHIMQQAAKNKQSQVDFDKKRSDARKIVDEAAEESEDEYAGLGGASDESGDDEENEDDRQMIDEDTQVGKGDEAKLAGLYADRERERDEKEVSKLLKDITTGALRRKRGVGDDLDLSDEEDAAARRREAKRREFARMRRELLKDEAVGKFAEDKKKEPFLRSIEDREAADEDDDDFDHYLQHNPETQSQSQDQDVLVTNSQQESQLDHKLGHQLETSSESKLNRLPSALRRTNPSFNRKPATLAEIRDSVSFLIEEPDSQAGMVDLGLSDSEEEPEAYVNLDRHFKEAEADENELDDDDENLGDFIVDDEPLSKLNSSSDIFKKPEIPRQDRAPFTDRRTKHVDVIDRLSLLRQSSSSTSNATANGSVATKMAFFSSKSNGSFSGVPTLLRRATTNSGLGSMSGRENVSATGVVTNKTERGNAGEEKEFIRKGNGGRRNAVNYQGERKTLREEKMSARAGIMKAQKGKQGKGFLGGLFRGNSWE